MTTTEIRELIFEALALHACEHGTPEHVETFAERGLLTRDEGLVIGLEDGSEFQLTIVRSA